MGITACGANCKTGRAACCSIHHLGPKQLVLTPGHTHPASTVRRMRACENRPLGRTGSCPTTAQATGTCSAMQISVGRPSESQRALWHWWSCWCLLCLVAAAAHLRCTAPARAVHASVIMSPATGMGSASQGPLGASPQSSHAAQALRIHAPQGETSVIAAWQRRVREETGCGTQVSSNQSFLPVDHRQCHVIFLVF